MTDYYALIKRAVSRLDSAAPRERRRALYERARAAQTTQLRTISPALSEAEIVSEQLALEEAVRRVEAETTKRSGQVLVQTLSDLLAAAEEIGEPVTRAESAACVVRAEALVNPFAPPDQSIEVPPPMVICGGGTGRLVRYWRWRSLPPRSVASNLASGR
jgi:hypothetical protein